MADSFRDKFIEHIKSETYKRVKQHKAFKNVEEKIISFFKEIEKDITEEYIPFSKLKIQYGIENNIVKITLEKQFLSFEKDLDENGVEFIKVKYSDCAYKDNCRTIIKFKDNNGSGEYLDISDTTVDEGLLDYYLKKAFENFI